MQKILSSILASLVKSLYRKVRPASQPSERSTRMPSLLRVVSYALLALGTMALTVSWLVVYGFPQIPQLIPSSWQLPSLHIKWSMSTAIRMAGVALLLSILVWLFKSLRDEKRALAEASKEVPAWQMTAPPAAVPQAVTENVVAFEKPTMPPTEIAWQVFQPQRPLPKEVVDTTPEGGESVVPAHAEHVATTTQSEEEIDETVDEEVSPTIEDPPSRVNEDDSEEAGASWLLSGLGRALPWGLAIALLAVLMFSGKNTETPEQQTQAQAAKAKPVKSAPAAKTVGCKMDPAADPVIVNATGEWSPLYCTTPGMQVDIRAYSGDASFELDIQDGEAKGLYRFTDNKIYRLESEEDSDPEEIEGVVGSIFEVRVRGIGDEPVKIRIKLLEA